jgi:hypothetical protein
MSDLKSGRPSIYSESQPMEPIEIVYTYNGAGWMATSADLKARFGEVVAAGDDTYELTRARVMDALRWSLDDQGLEFEHFVHESAIPALLAEREREAAKARAA